MAAYCRYLWRRRGPVSAGLLGAAIAVLILSCTAPPAGAFSGLPAGRESPPPSCPACEQDLIVLVNAARRAEGLPPLKLVDCLTREARYQAVDMRDDGYQHHATYDAGGTFVCSFWERIRRFCPTMATGADLLAGGYTQPRLAVNAWLSSAAHRPLLLSSAFREAGVGFCSGGEYGRYWVCDLGAHRDVFPLVIDGEADSTATPLVSLYIYGAAEWGEVRLRNDGEAWTEWRPFVSELSWSLRSESGVRAVWAEMRKDSLTAQSRDEIVLTLASASASPALGSAEPAGPSGPEPGSRDW